MLKTERKVITSIEKNIWIWITAIVFLLSLTIRIIFLFYESTDMKIFLLPWYDALENQGAAYLVTETSYDYTPLYLYLFKLFSFLPFSEIINIKLLSVIFDYLCSIIMALSAYFLSKGNRSRNALIAFCFGCFSPLTIMNAAIWGQCDAIYAGFSILCIYFLAKEKYLPSFIFLSLSFCFKLQTIFILPVIILYYLLHKKFSALYFLIIPVLPLLSGIPFAFLGLNPLSNFTVYVKQSGFYGEMSKGYSNFYVQITENNGLINHYRLATSAFTCFLILIIAGFVVTKKLKFTPKGIYLFTAFMVFLCTFFLPTMHDRYAFTGEILLLICITVNYRRLYVFASAIMIYLASISSYTDYLFGFYLFPIQYMGVLNFAGLILLGIELFKPIKNSVSGYNDYFMTVGTGSFVRF